jgi:hypothetical protein
VTVKNVGNKTGSFEVTLLITDNINVTSNKDTDELDGGESEEVTFEGVTEGLSPGNYSVTVSTEDNITSGTLTVEQEGESALSAPSTTGRSADAVPQRDIGTDAPGWSSVRATGLFRST